MEQATTTSDPAPLLLDEVPALRALDKATICLHFVDNPNDFRSIVEGEAELVLQGDLRRPCSVICSMELDLIAYAFQDQHLIQSNLTYDEPAEVVHCLVEAHFPGEVTYTSEGIPRTLRARNVDAGEAVVRCEARLAQSYFRESGILVWHVILRAAEGAFTEYELIKLMRLYERDTEQTGLADRVQFDVRSPVPRSRNFRCGVEGLLSAVWSCIAGEDFRTPPFFAPMRMRTPTETDRRPRAGTIQLVQGRHVAGQPLESILSTVYEGRRQATFSSDGHAGAHAVRTLKQWLREEEPDGVGATLKALAGVTIGIFDFHEVDEEEVLDTLDPTFRSGESFLKFHRRTLVNITGADRGLDAIYDLLGISPYLMIPHAVVVHNEELIDRLERCLDEYGDGEDIPRLERLALLARRTMQRMSVPNLFQYLTEKSLYDSAFELRGSAQKRQRVLERVNELERHLEKVYESRRRRHDIFVQALLLLLTIAQALSLFVDDVPDLGFANVLIAGLIVAVAGIYFLIRSRR